MKSSKPSPALNEAGQVFNSIRRLVRGLRVYTRECEAKLGLSGAQLFAMGQVQARQGLSMQELAAATLTDLSSVSVVVKRLEAKGLLIRGRAKEDQRRSVLRLTPAGIAVLKRSPDALQTRLLKALGDMPRAERKALNAGLASLLRRSGLGDERPEMFFEEQS